MLGTFVSANSTSVAVVPTEGQEKQRRAAASQTPAARSAGSSCAGALKYAPQPGAVFRACVDILPGYIKKRVLRLPVLGVLGEQGISISRIIN